MDWVAHRVETGHEAFTARRILLIATVFAFAASAKTIADWLIKKGDEAVLMGAPPWAIGTIAALVAVIYILFEYAHRQRMALVPRFGISFKEKGLGIVQGTVQLFNPFGQMLREYDSSYVRVQVDATSRRTVKVAAYVTQFEKSTDNGQTFSNVVLPQPIPLHAGTIDVVPNVPSMIDFASANEGSVQPHQHKLYPSGAWPFKLRDALKDNATYRFTIVVSDIDGNTKTIPVDVIWQGRWDNITAKQAGPVQ